MEYIRLVGIDSYRDDVTQFATVCEHRGKLQVIIVYVFNETANSKVSGFAQQLGRQLRVVTQSSTQIRSIECILPNLG